MDLIRELDDYQDQALSTAISHDTHPEDNPIDRYIFGLVDEAGEVAGKRKKQLRGDEKYQGDLQMARHMRDELGDVLWYLAVVAHLYGWNLSDIANRNAKKLQDRHERGALKGDGDYR